MVYDGAISYDHPALDLTVQNMFDANKRILQQMEDLVEQVSQNRAEFLGDSSDEYGLCADNIALELETSTTSLSNVSRGVQDGNEEFQRQDKKLAGYFG